MTVDKLPAWHVTGGPARPALLPVLARVLKSCVAASLSAAAGAPSAAPSPFASPALPPMRPGVHPSPRLLPLPAAAAAPFLGGPVESPTSGKGLAASPPPSPSVRLPPDVETAALVRQLLSFLLALPSARGQAPLARAPAPLQARAAAELARAVLDGLVVVRRLLCAAAAAAAPGACDVTAAFLARGGVEDVVDGVLLEHPVAEVRAGRRRPRPLRYPCHSLERSDTPCGTEEAVPALTTIPILPSVQFLRAALTTISILPSVQFLRAALPVGRRRCGPRPRASSATSRSPLRPTRRRQARAARAPASRGAWQHSCSAASPRFTTRSRAF